MVSPNWDEFVFLTIANDGYVELTLNLIQNFQQEHLKSYRLTVACLDHRAFEKISVNRSPNVQPWLFETSVPTGFCWFGEAGFARVTQTKYKAILALLRSAATVWYVDSDIVFLQDPLPYSNLEADIVLTSDARDPKHLYSTQLCTGSMLLHAGARTRSFLDCLVSRSGNRPEWNDQKLLNDLVFAETSDCP